jgi:hypothetical protein
MRTRLGVLRERTASRIDLTSDVLAIEANRLQHFGEDRVDMPRMQFELPALLLIKPL